MRTSSTIDDVKLTSLIAKYLSNIKTENKKFKLIS